MKSAFHYLLLASALTLAMGGVATASEPGDTGYIQTNLVSDGGAGGGGVDIPAAVIDPQLQNPWGIAFLPGSPLWIADNNADMATIYDGAGHALTPPAPGPGGFAIPGGAPTGTVANAVNNPQTGAFMVPNAPGTPGSSPALFIFDSENGIISGWQPGDGRTAVAMVDNSATGAVYKGLALGSNATGLFLFATNFNAGEVEMYDSSFKLVKTFTDPKAPAGYAPFGIANIDGLLYVTFAVQDSKKHDDVSGPGNGIVDVFDTSGKLIRHFAAGGRLNSPWGVTRAPVGFGFLSTDILIGNFGDGRINGYEPDGEFHDALETPDGVPIEIDGLWSITFPTSIWSGARGADPRTLYFTAGPGHEKDGLFGTLTPAKRH